MGARAVAALERRREAAKKRAQRKRDRQAALAAAAAAAEELASLKAGLRQGILPYFCFPTSFSLLTGVIKKETTFLLTPLCFFLPGAPCWLSMSATTHNNM